jgi:flagellar protein FlbT
MTLKISLAPAESVIIGKARVENGGEHRCTLIINGSETILREKRVMREADATSPLKRLYFVVQCIYLADDRPSLFDLFHQVSREAATASPTLTLGIVEVGEMVMAGNEYTALNKAYELVELERQAYAAKVPKGAMTSETAAKLALQTQQQLGKSSLSLASQAAKSILKLFP